MDAYGEGLGLLGDRTRRAIFELLGQGPCSVGELAEQLPISRPAVSQHLQLLKDAGLVLSESRGTRRIYRVNPDGVRALFGYLDRAAFPWPPGRPALESTRNGAGVPPTLPALHGSTTLATSPDKAFTAFTDSFDSWWPHQFHIGRAEMVEAVLEPRLGGRWYEKGIDGSESDWGQVIAWQPFGGLVLTWQIDGQWRYDPDPSHASEIEVRFHRDGPSRTVVHLEHRHLHRLVEGVAMYRALTSGGSWTVLLERFARRTTARS